jgi:hypothetical protein
MEVVRHLHLMIFDVALLCNRIRNSIECGAPTSAEHHDLADPQRLWGPVDHRA